MNQKLKTIITKLIPSPLMGTLILLGILVNLLFFVNFYCVPTTSLWIKALDIYGAFIATVLGIYISLYYTNKSEKLRDNEITNKTVNGTLKLIGSELDLTSTSLKMLKEGVETIPRNISHKELKQIFDYLSTHASIGLRSKVYYSTINSGAINEISSKNKTENIFNYIQQAYYNNELLYNSFLSSQLLFEDYSKKESLSGSEIALVNMIQEKTLEKTIFCHKLTDKAKNSIIEYLKEQNIEFKYEEDIIEQIGIHGE